MTDLSNEIQRRQQPAPQGESAGQMLQRMAPEFKKVLPRHLPVDQFLRLALNELRANPTLTQCTSHSFLGALMLAARLGLEPGGPTGQIYLTPRRVKGVWQVVPIIGYRGLRDLALGTGHVRSIQSFLVREGDTFRYGSNEERGFWHEWVPAEGEQDEADRAWTGVLTIAQLTGGGKPVWRYMSRKAVMDRKARGSAGDSGPWKTDEEAMARKTGIRGIAPDLPSNSLLSLAGQSDEQVQVYRPGEVPDPNVSAAITQEPEQPPAGVDTDTGEVKDDAPAPSQAEQAEAKNRRAGKPAAAKDEGKGQYAKPDPTDPPMKDYGDEIPVEDPPA